MKIKVSGGEIWIGKNLMTDSMLIDAGRIIAIGDEVKNLSFEQEIDLAGAFVMPAFADGHAHPLFGGREAQGPKVNGLNKISEILAQVRTFAAANPHAEWIVGGAYEAAIVERGDFDAHWLDEVVSDRPVVLHAVDHHTIWVNSKALEISGLIADTVDPEGGTIARRIDGSPKGTIREPSAMNLVLQNIPTRTLPDELAAIAWMSKQYLAAGVTSTMDAWG